MAAEKKEMEERKGKGRVAQGNRKRKQHILETRRHVGAAPGPKPDAVWVTRSEAGSAERGVKENAHLMLGVNYSVFQITHSSPTTLTAHRPYEKLTV